MKDKDEHFWIEDVINRLPSELVPDKTDWSSVLTALTKLKTERNNAVVERNELSAQVERLRGAAIALLMNRMGMDEWYALEAALSETPAQSLEALKRECNQEFVGDALDELPWYHDREFLRIDDLIKFAGIDS